MDMSANAADSAELAAKRGDYYSKWDKFADESVKEVEDEEVAEAAKAAEALGLKDAPMSEAEKRDKEKREALREAKKLWDQKKVAEASARLVLGQGDEGKEVVVDDTLLKGRNVVHFKGGKESTYRLPSNLTMRIVKVFIEDCENCTFELEAVTISQHVEVSHCGDCKVHVLAPQSIVQVDLCKGLELRYAKNVFDDKLHKVFHAGVSESVIHVHGDEVITHTEHVDYEKLGARQIEEKTREEHQFVTHMVDGKLVTEEVFRSKGNMPLTRAQIEEAERLGDGDGQQTEERMAELKKIGGNEAFQDGNYAQAAIFYTEAVDLAPEGSALKPLCYANRSFAHMKLGHLPEALADAEKAIELDPTYCKGHFRKGLALHALKRYLEAAQALSKALEIEPKNKQITQALGFAELRARKAGMCS